MALTQRPVCLASKTSVMNIPGNPTCRFLYPASIRISQFCLNTLISQRYYVSILSHSLMEQWTTIRLPLKTKVLSALVGSKNQGRSKDNGITSMPAASVLFILNNSIPRLNSTFDISIFQTESRVAHMTASKNNRVVFS